MDFPRHRLFLLCALLFVFAAIPASAQQFEIEPVYPDTTSDYGCQSYEECSIMADHDGTGVSNPYTGKYYSCAAKGSWNGSCVACVTLPSGARSCAQVKYSSSCQCDTKNCSTYGSCDYKA